MSRIAVTRIRSECSGSGGFVSDRLLGEWSAGATRAQTAAADSSPGAPVKVARAEAREMPVEIAATGNVEPFSTITVKAQIGGTLVKVPFRDGDMVREGDLLFEIDPRPYQEAILQWEANLARDRALLRQNEATLASAQAQEVHMACSRPISETSGPGDFFPRASRTDERGTEGAAFQC